MPASMLGRGISQAAAVAGALMCLSQTVAVYYRNMQDLDQPLCHCAGYRIHGKVSNIRCAGACAAVNCSFFYMSTEDVCTVKIPNGHSPSGNGKEIYEARGINHNNRKTIDVWDQPYSATKAYTGEHPKGVSCSQTSHLRLLGNVTADNETVLVFPSGDERDDVTECCYTSSNVTYPVWEVTLDTHYIVKKITVTTANDGSFENVRVSTRCYTGKNFKTIKFADYKGPYYGNQPLRFKNSRCGKKVHIRRNNNSTEPFSVCKVSIMVVKKQG